jgi:hypothetical protein
MVEMVEDNIDKKLVDWNKILDEIVGESEFFVKDLLDAIKYVAAAGILVICLGAYILYIGLRIGNTNDPWFILMMILAPGSNFVVGLYNLNKYFQLRDRYSRLYDVQKNLKK